MAGEGSNSVCLSPFWPFLATFLCTGFYLTFYENRDNAETGTGLVDSLPLDASTVCVYERGYFPRVKNAYHFGLRPKGAEKTTIFEVDNEEDLKDWVWISYVLFSLRGFFMFSTAPKYRLPHSRSRVVRIRNM